MRFVTIPSLALVLLLTGVVAAGEKAGVQMPDRMEASGKSLQLNGMGLREATIAKIDVYVAGLYLERPSSNPAEIVGSPQVKVLTLKFVRDVDREDILKAWHDGFRGNATAAAPLPKIQDRMNQLDSWMRDFSKGDTLTFTFVPGQGVHVDINGARAGTIAGDDFSASLLSIWLGPNPPTGDLKRGLLGRHG
jgi:hypothetical protein